MPNLRQPHRESPERLHHDERREERHHETDGDLERL
jgi:hypothetical protein